MHDPFESESISIIFLEISIFHPANKGLRFRGDALRKEVLYNKTGCQRNVMDGRTTVHKTVQEGLKMFDRHKLKLQQERRQ